MNLEESKVWRGEHRLVPFKIVLWGIGKEFACHGQGVWNYYVYLNEQKCTCFDKLWLEDIVYKYKPDVFGRVTHDYFGCEAINNIDFHCGVTYYTKYGHTVGYRSVEIGCDYNHLWDQENHYSLEDIVNDVKKTIDHIYSCGLLKTENA